MVGKVDVTVTSGAFTSAASGAANDYTYSATTPVVTGMTPLTGPTTGGTAVTVSGTGFVTGASVAFGTLAATDVVVVSPTQLTAVSPATITPGNANITVTTSGGTSEVTAQSPVFVYTTVAPTVTSLAPTSGSTAEPRSPTAQHARRTLRYPSVSCVIWYCSSFL